MDTRTADTLDPSKCRNLRTLPDISEQSAILDRILSNKSIEELSIKELKDIGLIYNEKSDYENARKYFNLALQRLKQGDPLLTLDEQSVIITYCQYGLANAERESGNDKEAIRRFEMAREECGLRSQDFDEYFKIKYDIERNMGIAYLKIQKLEKAVECFSIAIEVATTINKPGLIPAVKSYYGLSLVLSGAYQDGMKQLEEARSLYPSDARELSMDWASHRYHMGRAFQVMGDQINAISEFNESLRLRLQIISPKIGSIYFNSRVGDTHAGLGQSYLALGNSKEAEKWLKKALENFEALNNSGKVQEMQKALKSINGSMFEEISSGLQHLASQTKWQHVACATATALTVGGLGFFAYRFSKGSPAPVMNAAKQSLRRS